MLKSYVIAVSCLASTQGFAEPDKIIRAERVHESIEVDGRLDESGWKSAPHVSDFIVQDPDEGTPLSERTEVRVLYDDKRLYVGFECWDSEPLKVIANEMRRDANIWQNDNVYVMLDTYGDRRRNYFFRLNALGAYEDAAVTDDGENINGNWDAIVDAVGHRHDEGWTLELAIPFNQLRFKESPSMTWGVNFGRNILYKHLSSQWAPIPRSESYMGTYRPRYQGKLVGLDGIKSSAHLDFVPYLLRGLSQDELNRWDTRTERGVGVDVKYGITPNLTLDLTTNTDFAQVEADQEQVNLDRFDMYFPEKRDFFLEGSGLFDFGVGFGGFEPPQMSLFYSRRIGIEGDVRARILGGGKLTGKVGGTTIGLLNLTDEAVADVPQTNFTVLRLQQDILERSTAGFIVTNRQTGVGGRYARNAGVDLALRLRPRWQIRALTAGSFSPDETKSGTTWYLANQYANDHFDFEVNHLDVGPDFAAETGFVQRTGIRQTGGHFGVGARPNWHGVSNLFLGSGGGYLTDHDGERIGYDFGSHFELGRLAGGGGWVGVGRRLDKIDEPFDIETVTIPAAEYDSVSVEAGIFTPEQYPVASEIHLDAGDFFHGSRVGLRMSPRWRIAPQLAVETWLDLNRLEFPDAVLTTRVVGSRAHFTLNTKFYTKLFAQWNDTAERFSANALVRYIYQPGSDFYVVYDQRWNTGDGMRVSGWTLLSKFTYLVSY